MKSGTQMNVSGAPPNVDSSNEALDKLDKLNVKLADLRKKGRGKDHPDITKYSNLWELAYKQLMLSESA
jgi:hypothetical protein